MGCAPSEHKDMGGGGLSLEKVFAKSYAHRVNIELFIAGRDQAVGAITSHANFIVSGWLDINYLTRGHISLLSGGEPLDCPAVKCMNSGKSNGAVDANSTERFQFVIPGYVWQGRKSDETLEFQISSGEEILHTQALELNTILVQHWLVNIKKYNNQYFSLLALEHLSYYPSFKLLSADTIKHYTSLASEHNLSAPRFKSTIGPAANPTKKSETSTVRIINKALKSLNQALTRRPEDVIKQIKFHIEKFNMNEACKLEFLSFLVPYMCRENLFSEFSKTVDARGVKNLLISKRGDSNLTKLLAFQAMEKSPHLISKTLYAISENNICGEWLHTECVNFACSYSMNLAGKGIYTDSDHAEICYAFLNLLESLSKGSFSRLHDHMLIDTAVGYLSDLDDHPSWLQRDLVESAIKYYGLNSYFWHAIEDSRNATAWFDVQFKGAHRHWKVINSSLEPNSKNAGETPHSLSFFLSKGNVDAPHFSRVFLLHELKSTDLDTGALNRTTDQLAKQAPLEHLRISSNPQSSEFASGDKQGREQVLEQIRRESGNDNISYYIQKQAALCLENLISACNDGDTTDIAKEYNGLISSSSQLCKANHSYIGIELFVFSLAQLTSKTFDDSEIVNLILRALTRVCENTQSDEILSPTLYSALTLITQSKLKENGPIMRLVGKLTGKDKPLHGSLRKGKSRLPAPRNTPTLFNDTILVIYSCRNYLDTRIKAIRETWLKDVKLLGIPYVILVGDGDDQMQGDILALDVADTYEELPQKSLKLYEWIHSHTDAQFVLKIDDDCFLDAKEYFYSLSYRKHHYYGRVLERSHTTMNRLWHQDKSHSFRARHSIDKSPTPSTYADGGSSYCLSRLAITKLLKSANTAEGQHLVHSSYMEDKLVGDLLSLSKIHPANEDLSVYIRRRTFPNASPVGMWANSFYPSKPLPVKVVHLDTDKDMTSTYEHLGKDAYWPKKIWPTIQDVSLLEHRNQLELLTPLKQTQQLLEEDVFVTSVLRNEIVMLPHFLDHYRSIGVKAFIMVDNLSDDGSREYILDQPDVVLYSADTDYNKSHYGVVWQQAVLSNHCLNKWVLMADADEFLVYPDSETKDLADYVKRIEGGGYDCVRTDKIDMFPAGDLVAADFNKMKPFDCAAYYDRNPICRYNFSSGIYSNHTSNVSSLRHRLDPAAEPYAYSSQKYALIKYKPWMMFSEGLHDATGITVSDEITYFAHFKYHKGFKEKSLIEVERGQHYAGAAEYKRYLSLLVEMEGQFYDKAHSVMFDNSEVFSSHVSKE